MAIFQLDLQFRDRWRRAPLRRATGAVLAATMLALTAQGASIWLGGNFHVVIPGHVYRSAQPSRADMEWAAREYGVRTIVNLRGVYRPRSAYDEHHQRAASLDLRMVDVGNVWRGSPPPREAVERLILVLDSAPQPILLHCSSGSDRTGWAAGVALLLADCSTVADARGQLALCYGHWRYGNARALDEFFVSYDNWLAANGYAHTPEQFRSWVASDYLN